MSEAGPPPRYCLSKEKRGRQHSTSCPCRACTAKKSGSQSQSQPAPAAEQAAGCRCDYCVIKQFDLDPLYGPRSGLTRHERLALSKRLGEVPAEYEEAVLRYRDEEYNVR